MGVVDLFVLMVVGGHGAARLAKARGLSARRCGGADKSSRSGRASDDMCSIQMVALPGISAAVLLLSGICPRTRCIATSRSISSHTAAYRALHKFPVRGTDLAARGTLLSRHEYFAQLILAFALLKRRASGS